MWAKLALFFSLLFSLQILSFNNTKNVSNTVLKRCLKEKNERGEWMMYVVTWEMRMKCLSDSSQKHAVTLPHALLSYFLVLSTSLLALTLLSLSVPYTKHKPYYPVLKKLVCEKERKNLWKKEREKLREEGELIRPHLNVVFQAWFLPSRRRSLLVLRQNILLYILLLLLLLLLLVVIMKGKNQVRKKKVREKGRKKSSFAEIGKESMESKVWLRAVAEQLSSNFSHSFSSFLPFSLSLLFS